MEKMNKPKLVFFQWRHEGLPKFLQLHMQLHVKCLAEFFEVILINEDCDYQQICDTYQPDLALFESGYRTAISQKIKIKNTSAHPEIPKLGFHNGDAWCDWRTGFISDMEHWGIETFFSICITTAEHTPEIADNLFVWPNFADADTYRDYGQPKVVPVLFNGINNLLYPWRGRIYKTISQNYPSLIFPHLGYESRSPMMISGEQYARTINASLFVPACGTVAKELVRKHFEIPGSKSCLITEKSPALEAAGFIDMLNCVFADENDVLDKLDYLFQNSDELERVTNAGYQLVHSRHTLKQRDQIFQWFKLYKNLKLNQKIVQTSPFEPLTIVEKSSGIKNSHIVCNGLHLVLLCQGDEKLWAGKYDEAEALYLKSLNYIHWMREPKLRLALCNLYKGNAANALLWIAELNNITFNAYKASDPDPVEWAYFIISLLSQGKLNEAIIRANQFPSLCHPELNRTRWVINSMQAKRDSLPVPYTEPLKSRYSIHQLPSRSITDWIDNLLTLLEACQQFSLADTLRNSVLPENQPAEEQKKTRNNVAQVWRKNLLSIRVAWLQFLDFVFEILYVPNPPSLPPISGLDYIVRLGKAARINILKRLAVKYSNYLKVSMIRLLPNRLEKISNNELSHVIQNLLQEEDIRTAVTIDRSTGEEGLELTLHSIQKSRKIVTALFCVSISTPKFTNLQKHYANDSFVKFYTVSSTAVEELTCEIQGVIKTIKQKNNINSFDFALINSLEVSVNEEFDELQGTKFIMLNNIDTLENLKNHHRLLTNPNYTLIAHNPILNNGYAIFRKVELPIGKTPFLEMDI
jgi:Glycosyl transferases group 1